MRLTPAPLVAGVHRRSAAGVIPAADWNNPATIVSRLTQTPAAGETVNSSIRCGPASLLGATVMQGREATARLAERLATGEGANGERFRAIASRVRSSTATFEDLGALQDEMYARGNRRNFDVETLLRRVDDRVHGDNPARGDISVSEWNAQLDELRRRPVNDANARILSSLTGRDIRAEGGRYFELLPVDTARRSQVAFYDRELQDLSNLTHGTHRAGAINSLTDRLSQLEPGQSTLFRVAGSATSDHDDHFVTLGRDANGVPFLYNPDPRPGDATLTTGAAQGPQPAAFAAALATYQGRRLGPALAVTVE